MHLFRKLLRRQIYILDLHFKVLPSRERQFFLLNLFVGHGYAKIIHRLPCVKGTNNLGDLFLAENSLLVLSVHFLFGAQLRGIHQHYFAFLIIFVQKQDGDICSCIRKDIRRHRNHTAEPFFVYQIFVNCVSNRI